MIKEMRELKWEEIGRRVTGALQKNEKIEKNKKKNEK